MSSSSPGAPEGLPVASPMRPNPLRRGLEDMQRGTGSDIHGNVGAGGGLASLDARWLLDPSVCPLERSDRLPPSRAGRTVLSESRNPTIARPQQLTVVRSSTGARVQG
jgi:hypothetical protein